MVKSISLFPNTTVAFDKDLILISSQSTEKTPLFQAKYPKELKEKRLKKPLFYINHLGELFRKLFFSTLLGIIKMVTGGGMEKIILPAVDQFKNLKESINAHKQRFVDNSLNLCSPISFKTADGFKIDGMIKWHHQSDYKQGTKNPANHEPYKNRKWIICFNPNAMCYEQLINWADAYSQKSQCNILLFNYRGVVNSEGYPTCSDDLILDGDAAIQFLLDKGVDSTSIVLHGISLGGGVATQVRALHPNGPLAVERSFSSLSLLVQGIIYKLLIKKAKATPVYQKIFADAVARTIGCLAQSVLNETKWELNSLKKWPEVKGIKWIITCGKDRLICGIGRLSHALKKQLREYADPEHMEKILKEELNLIKSEGSGHCDGLTLEAEDSHYNFIQKALGVNGVVA